MQESIIVSVGLGFIKLMESGQDGYGLIRFKVPLTCLLSAYDQMIKTEITPIEFLPQDEKLKYWDIAKVYYPEKDKAIVASKAAYILSVITNTE